MTTILILLMLAYGATMFMVCTKHADKSVQPFKELFRSSEDKLREMKQDYNRIFKE